MRLSRSCILLLCFLILAPHVMAQHNPETLLFRRTDNLPGADFTGVLPANVDQEAPFGELDDPASSLISALDVDREPGTAEIDLLGDNYDLAFGITIVIFVTGAVFMTLASPPKPPTPEPTPAPV